MLNSRLIILENIENIFPDVSELTTTVSFVLLNAISKDHPRNLQETPPSQPPNEDDPIFNTWNLSAACLLALSLILAVFSLQLVGMCRHTAKLDVSDARVT